MYNGYINRSNYIGFFSLISIEKVIKRDLSLPGIYKSYDGLFL